MRGSALPETRGRHDYRGDREYPGVLGTNVPASGEEVSVLHPINATAATIGQAMHGICMWSRTRFSVMPDG